MQRSPYSSVALFEMHETVRLEAPVVRCILSSASQGGQSMTVLKELSLLHKETNAKKGGVTASLQEEITQSYWQ